MTNDDINKIIDWITLAYKKTENIGTLPLREIRLSDSIINDIELLQPELLAQEGLDINQVSTCSGYTLLFPDNTATILLKKEASMDHMGWIETLAHELTHVKDFVDYYPILHRENFSEMLKFIPFWYWTEFHARYKGHVYMLALATKLPELPEQYLNKYIDRLPEQINSIVTIITSDIDYRNKAYYVMHFIGELFAFEQFELVNDQLQKSYDDIFEKFNWLPEMIDFLAKHINGISFEEMSLLSLRLTQFLQG